MDGNENRSAVPPALRIFVVENNEDTRGLPDGSGWELLQRLVQETPFYAVAISGFGLRADREKSRVAGFRHHLVKPVDAEQLERVLEEARRERDGRESAA